MTGGRPHPKRSWTDLAGVRAIRVDFLDGAGWCQPHPRCVGRYPAREDMSLLLMFSHLEGGLFLVVLDEQGAKVQVSGVSGVSAAG